MCIEILIKVIGDLVLFGVRKILISLIEGEDDFLVVVVLEMFEDVVG